MASNPPFQLEDNTDEDFFDKLVDDDIGPSELSSPTVSKIAEGNKTDDANVLTNPSNGENSGGEDRPHEPNVTDDHVDSGASGSLVAQADEASDSSLAGSETVGLDSTSVTESKEVGLGSQESEQVSESMDLGAGSGGAGVKEVGWSSFFGDSSENDHHGFGSYSDFLGDMGDSSRELPLAEVNANGVGKVVAATEEIETVSLDNSANCSQYGDGQEYESCGYQGANDQDLNNSQYWENMYPGWKYDPNTGQWYQVDGYDATLSSEASYDNSTNGWNGASDVKSDVSYLQQSFQSNMGTAVETSTTESVSNWGQVSQSDNGYPEHMVFDPQYPGWYYDTIAQEWCTLETYNAAAQSTVQAHHNQNGFVSGSDNNTLYGEYGHTDKYASHNLGSQGEHGSWAESYNSYSHHKAKTWEPETLANTVSPSNFSGNQQVSNLYGSKGLVNSHYDQQKCFSSPETIQLNDKVRHGQVEANGHSGVDNFVQSGNFNPGSIKQNESMSFSNDFYGSQKKQNAQMSFSNDFYGSQKKHNKQMSFSNDFYDSQKQSEQMSFSNDFSGSQMNQNIQMGRSNDFYVSKNNTTNGQISLPNDPYGTHEQVNTGHHSYQSSQQFSYAPVVGRSSAGRPAHTLVSFGFGGKLVLLKSTSSMPNTSFGSQDLVGSSISVLNVMEVITGNNNASSVRGGNCAYIRALSQQCFPGPLVGGSAGSKDLNKWIDDRIADCRSPDMDYRKGEVLRLLLSLIKIACQHYGKLRSPFGADTALRDSDTPEIAVAKLFASAKNNGSQYSPCGDLTDCLQQLPSEEQMRATAYEVQNFLVSGRKREALQCAQEGHLWGLALVLASQLGDQFYVDTVTQMALRQLVAGSPLRTLCLLVAGQPAEVFSADSAVNMAPQPAQFGANGMLNDWEKNLALITANRTKDDELVIIHLGDCLWKERSEITAAHICYIVADANFEVYSDTARLCLIGADHWKFPRTYASPEAIQRTELYEYSKVLGNSQFILVPFQPYKLIYAYMLAEVGKVSDAFKYCQAISKSLKTGRAPEVETWKQLVSSLEERIRIHQQGGYTNLAPTKLVGKLLNFFDSTAHRVVGGLPPPSPATSHGHVQGNENHQQVPPRVSASQSTTTMSSLIPSASMEPISDWASDGNRMKAAHTRSASEPDFGRTPRQVHSSKDETSSSGQGKTSGSRFGRFSFGSQLLQKTVGLVLRPRSDKQAKLGETNKFYYDEKLKRWIEEGSDPPAEEAALAPPPTASAFQNGLSDYNRKSAMKNEGSPPSGSPKKLRSPTKIEQSSGIPPIPSSTNQFSARGRMGVRGRYVDTFNQGRGNSGNSFHSPAVPSVKPAAATKAKVFVPTASASGERTTDFMSEDKPEYNNSPSTSSPTTTSSPVTMQRYPSMNNISRKSPLINGKGILAVQSRRTSSWSGANFDPIFSPPGMGEVKPLGEALGIPPSAYIPSPMNGKNLGDELHEVEL